MKILFALVSAYMDFIEVTECGFGQDTRESVVIIRQEKFDSMNLMVSSYNKVVHDAFLLTLHTFHCLLFFTFQMHLT